MDPLLQCSPAQRLSITPTQSSSGDCVYACTPLSFPRLLTTCCGGVSGVLGRVSCCCTSILVSLLSTRVEIFWINLDPLCLSEQLIPICLVPSHSTGSEKSSVLRTPLSLGHTGMAGHPCFPWTHTCFSLCFVSSSVT